MLPVTLWTVRTLAVVLWMLHGSYLAVTASDWREDRWEEDMPHPAGSVLDLSDTSGMYAGCLSVFFYFVAWIRFRILLHGCTRVVTPLAAFGLALLGWPVTPYWQDMDLLRYVFVAPGMLLLEPCTWISIGSFLTGYLAGRLAHRSFFGERM